MVKKSSRHWLQEHATDLYVKQAKLSGFRSRAAYKLLQLHERDRLFKTGMIVIDLGSSPGGWSQVVAQLVKPKGKVFALDLLPMEPISGVDYVQGDFTQEATFNALLKKLSEIQADWVISDMAPNMSGNASIDVPRSLYLAELALDFSLKLLNNQGGFLVKVLQGEGFNSLLDQIKGSFKKVVIRKPKASRGRSKEVYILARERKK